MSRVKYEYKGAKGLTEISKLTGICKATIKARMQRNKCSVKEAVEHQAEESRPEWQGHVGFTAIANAFGIERSTLSNRVRKMGLSIEEALTKESFHKGNKRADKKESLENGLLTKLDPRWKLALGIKECA
ncbi:hypothetical protein, partial [Vibrio vulnificus]|uniref:hypothetical protein n=1 Tax=Vibrio vulnificus TaxID=672 RepID=UPI00063D9059